jgi:hypothetical protein
LGLGVLGADQLVLFELVALIDDIALYEGGKSQIDLVVVVAAKHQFAAVGESVRSAKEYFHVGRSTATVAPVLSIEDVGLDLGGFDRGLSKGC